MYKIPIFEKAIEICGYKLDRIFQCKNSVNKAEGRIYYQKKLSVNGQMKTVKRHRRVRWDSVGRCFSYWQNKRMREYDLPLRTISEEETLKTNL